MRVLIFSALLIVLSTPTVSNERQFIFKVPEAVTCDQTLSSGNDVDSAYAAVADGVTWTICLNNGTYSGAAVAFANETRTSGYVTIRSVNPLGATLSGITFNNVDYLRLTDLMLSTATATNCSTHLEFVGNTWVENAGGLFFNEEAACGAQALLVDGDTFANVDMQGFEGRLSTREGLNGLTVTNSFFGSDGYGDGIQVGGGTNIVIGPGNIFDGISQAFCNANGGAHCDAIQIFCGLGGPVDCYAGAAADALTITSNWFKNSETMIMAPDGSNNVIVEFNVFDWTGTSYPFPIQFGSAVSPIFRHNTIRSPTGFEAAFDSKAGETATSNLLAENNVLHAGGWKTDGGNGCTSCTFRFNLYSDSGAAVGTNNVIGTPDYLGGTTPTTWAGWQLDAGSPGENAGNDGQDMGTTYYGP